MLAVRCFCVVELYQILNIKIMHLVFKGQILLIHAKVAEKMNLKNGQNILTESMFWDIIKTNAEYNILEISAKISQN